MLNLFSQETTKQIEQLKQKLTTAHALSENSPINIMMANTNMVITYANPASIRTLKTIERLLPCKAEEVVGKSIDDFHKNPSHQRKLLSDPKNLPYRAVISLADQKLDLLASPMFDDAGKYIGPMVTWEVVTEKLRIQEQNADFTSQIAAIHKCMAVIEFQPDGTILTANDNFLRVSGYTLAELQGQHHRLFVAANYAQSSEYRDFWISLAKGQDQTAEFQRFGKGGREIWMFASYNPILDKEGKVIKVVKLATDITEQVRLKQEAEVQKQRDIAAAKELQHKVDLLLNVVTAAAQGDLCQNVTVTGDDAMGQLGNGIRNMLADLRSVIGQVVEGATQFAEGAHVISESSQTLAHGAQTQSLSVDRMNGSIANLNQSISQVRDHATEANQMAIETNRMATEGEQAVNKSIEAMSLIQRSSLQISEIIQVISEIASQTNMLALNAAIEAARAGEHGLGFAVVADEVRKLAERSSEAAKQISKLIRESSQRVDDGAKQSSQTGDALQRIIAGVESTAAKIALIAGSTQEQAAIAGEVASGIASVTTVTEQLAAASEELASSSEELGAQASTLKEIVVRFRVE
jgi:methyl-accepting chemotaxis protein